MTKDRLVSSVQDLPLDLLDAHVESFLHHLVDSGYAESTLRKKRRIAESFTRWARRTQIPVSGLCELHIVEFVRRSPRRRKAHELSVLRPFLCHLRTHAGVPTPVHHESSPADALAQRYVDYLRDERGLAENSILVYSRYVCDFIANTMFRAKSDHRKGLDALAVRVFLLDRIRDRSSEYSRLLAISLRSFLRFLYCRGETEFDLSAAVPTVRKWRQATIPTFLTSREVECVLSATDRSTSRGRRDHAILLLLARLGLRAGEVVTLELDDIHWRTGEIVIHGKGRALDHLPLVSDVGKALALYLRRDRGNSSSRRVFLRMIAPRLGLAGPAAVGHIVRKAIGDAGLHRLGRGAAHLFRHSLATKMIRNSASIAEISEVLRHRSHNTTQIYTKVAFEDLRGVARPWPGSGGAP